MSMPVPGRVFISFASQDLELADRFLAAIEAGGIPCWIAHRDIPPGSSYPAEITSAIGAAGAMLVLITPASNASPHVLREVEMAFNAAKPILPVHLSRVALSPNLTYFLSTKQWLDAGEAFDADDTDRVLSSLRHLLAGGSDDVGGAPAATGGGGTDRHRRPRMLVGLLAAALIVALAITLFLMQRGRDSAPRIADGTTVAPGAGAPRPPSASPNTASPPAGVPPGAVSSAPPTPARGTAPADVTSPTESRRRSRINPVDGQTYMWIPAGEFTMGCSSGDPSCERDEQPSHQVALSRPFWLGRTEVTGAQYHKVRPRAPGSAATPDSPITEVTWAQAKAYCHAVGGRLPREAEWEYAARAGGVTRAYGPLEAISWFAKNSEAHAQPVGMLKANRFGLFDMLGNVHEWVLDRYFDKYDEEGGDAQVIEPTAANASAVVRGGAWTSAAKDVRASARLARDPDAAEPNIGFRCAMD